MNDVLVCGYDATGEDGLTDKRSRHKTEDEVDELERLRRENLPSNASLRKKIWWLNC